MGSEADKQVASERLQQCESAVLGALNGPITTSREAPETLESWSELLEADFAEHRSHATGLPRTFLSSAAAIAAVVLPAAVMRPEVGRLLVELSGRMVVGGSWIDEPNFEPPDDPYDVAGEAAAEFQYVVSCLEDSGWFDGRYSMEPTVAVLAHFPKIASCFVGASLLRNELRRPLLDALLAIELLLGDP